MTTSTKPKPRRRHGIGADGVNALLAEQGGRCAICGVPYEDKPGKRLAMDHDHAHCPGPVGCPLCVRGLLCNHDNNLLRLSGESIPRLEAAISYLRKHQRGKSESDGVTLGSQHSP